MFELKKQSIHGLPPSQLQQFLTVYEATNEMPEWLQKNYDRLNIVATYNLIFNASILVWEGLGYALGFDKLVNTGAESILCFRPIIPTISSPMRLIWRKILNQQICNDHICFW